MESTVKIKMTLNRLIKLKTQVITAIAEAKELLHYSVLDTSIIITKWSKSAAELAEQIHVQQLEATTAMVEYHKLLKALQCIKAMIHLKNGEKILIQALGGRFGSLNSAPFVLLRADDRTGQTSGGEWLDINGQQWSQIEEVFIFAFIYEGAPNWAQTDGIVTIHVPDQPPIETRLTEGAGNLPMCAIARLVNQHGSINVERINQYFEGHKEIDKAFNWGFSWKTARK